MDPNAILVFDRASVRRIDESAVQEYGLPGIVLMENAARALFIEALDMLGPGRTAGSGGVLIVAGAGNNGGDGWALARFLHNAGVRVVVASLGEPRPESDAAINRQVCRAMNLDEIAAENLEIQAREFDLIVDAIFGTGLSRGIEGDAVEAIDSINRANRPVLAVDLPSGLDCDRGLPFGDATSQGPCVRAARTVTFVGLKRGFLNPDSERWTGRVVIGDIGCPRALIERFGTPVMNPRSPSGRS